MNGSPGLEIWAVGLLLVAAVTHATWNAVVKVSESRLLTLTTIMGVSGLCFLPMILIFEPPAPASWPYLGASVLLHTVYYLTLIWAYRHGDLSVAYPIARGSAPLIVAIGAYLFAEQSLDIVVTFGIVLTSFGIMMFAFERGWPGRASIKPFVSAISVSIMIGVYTVIDGIGLRQTPDPFSYIGWLFVLDALPVLIFVMVTQRRAFLSHVRITWRREAVGGILSAVAYTLVLYVLSFSGMAQVAAIRETSVLFAVMIAALFLNERFGAYRWTAAAIVTTGVIIMQLNS